MSAITAALLADLTDEQWDMVADRLAPRLADRLGQRQPADGWLRGADAIAGYIAAPPSRVYALTSAKRIPVERDGANLIARRSELDEWLRAGGAKRP